MTVSLRAAVPADAPAIARLGRRVTDATYVPLGGQDYADHVVETWWQPDVMAASMDRVAHVVAVRDDDPDDVVGLATLGERDGAAVIWKLYLDPDLHRSGIGTRLLDAAVTVARERGHAHVLLSHVAGNDRAAAFYRARGFTHLRVEPDPPWPDQVWLSRPTTPVPGVAG